MTGHDDQRAPSDARTRFLDDLSAAVDGDADALRAAEELLADSDEARDLLFDARRLAGEVREAGGDYVPQPDLEARVLAALDARSGQAVSPAPQPSAPPQAARAVESAAALVAPAAQPDATTEVDPPLSRWAGGGGSTDKAEAFRSATTSGVGAATKSRMSEPDVASNERPQGSTPHAGVRRSGLALVVGGGALFAIAAATTLAFVGSKMFTEAPDAPVVAVQGWSAEVQTVVRAADASSESGVSIRAAGASEFVAVAEGATLSNGATLRTDARTRAQLRLSDGTELVLNRDTEVSLETTGARDLRLTRGELLASVAHLDNGPNANLYTPHGHIEVLGTKFLLTTDDQVASVQVLRGEVRAHGASGHAEVKAGQEGVLRPGQAARVTPAMHLASQVGWSELGDVAGDEDMPVPGIGELRAHRPGERQAQERPLAISEHKVSVRIVGNVARTEVEEAFRNDGNDVLEGVYRFPMPPDARVASLQLLIDGNWEEGAIVGRDRAQAIWRGVIRNATPQQERQQQQEEWIWVPGPWRDPALLEWQRGGRFELRIFPIPAHGERRVRITYEQTIAPSAAGERRYVYPMAHSAADDDSTRVGHFEVDVRVAGENVAAKAVGYEMAGAREEGADRLRFSSENFRPAGDLIVEYQLPGGEAEVRYWTFQGSATTPPGERSSSRSERTNSSRQNAEDQSVALQQAIHADARPYVVFALRPELPAWNEQRPRSYAFVLDSSQSMVGERFERAGQLLRRVISEMDRRDRFTVLACDVSCESFGDPTTPTADAVAQLERFLTKVEPAGSTDVVMALRAGQTALMSGQEGREAHVVYVGDGLSSTGYRRASLISGQVTELARSGVSFNTLGIGQDADANVLAAVAQAGGGQYVPFVPGQRIGEAAIAVLEATYGASLRNVTLQVPAGITDVSPASLPTLRAGQEVLVVGRMASSAPIGGELRLTGTVAGQPFENRYPVTLTPTTSAGNGFVPRVFASTTITELERSAKGSDNARIVALSKAFQVLSSQTSMLVLESEAMFRAFSVDRARPAITWTGEDDMVEGTSSGVVDMSGSAGGGAGSLGETRRRSASGAGMESMADLASGASATPSRRPSAASPSPSVSAMSVAMEGLNPFDDGMNRAQQMPPRGGMMRRMRRVSIREGYVRSDASIRDRDLEAVTAAEAALREQPDSRDRHRNLVRALSRAGSLVRAEEVARQWIARDALDTEALTYLSDVVGRRGERDRALRYLSGIVDLNPESEALQERLALAYERAGKTEAACGHRVALAEIDSDDATHVADAARCRRGLGDAAGAEGLLSGMDTPRNMERARTEVERPASPESVRGDLMLDATWSGSDDVDLTLVTPQGTRLSWMGGRTSVVGEDAGRSGRERLGLRRAGVGSYYIEVARVQSSDNQPVRGEIRVRTPSETRTIPFVLSDQRVVAGRVDIVTRWVVR
ncbi:MAG: FecR domain-containing protein [Myxococcales bacterium]|nr:FecR domain-containing protein [Myxococcales bacterium]MCB9628322.1 FecR domain-containing protein [Sandaracinaceae bacterium]